MIKAFSFLIAVAASVSATSEYDADFLACCKSQDVTESCQALCQYDINPDDVEEAFTNGTCDQVKDTTPYYQCLENNKNMTHCCTYIGGGVINKTNFYCLDLCDGSTPLKYDEKYLNCKPMMPAVMSCGVKSHEVEPLIADDHDTREYTVFPMKNDYVFYGKIVCKNGAEKQKGRVVLVEQDNLSIWNDEVAATYVIGDRFQLIANKYITDPPTSQLELYLRFEGFCGMWFWRNSGYLKNGTLIEYTLLTDKVWTRELE